MKKIEVNLGIGINMFFPEPVTIVIEDEVNDEPVKKKVSKPKIKETAVEWLLSMLDYNQQMLGTKEIIEKAKEIEREQIRNSYLTEIEMQCIDPNCDGINKKGICIPSNKPKLDSEGCLIFKNK
jgi:acetoacetate decarboxylase